MSPSLSHSFVRALTHEQRLEIRLDLRRNLTDAVRGERYTPSAQCPLCGRKLSEVEILKGFLDDPYDFTTKCTNISCGHRFQPKLKMVTAIATLEMPFYCAAQTLGQLKGNENVPLEEFSTRLASVHKSAVYHFGSLTSAFANAGLTYGHSEQLDWKEKVKPFLGRLSDPMIADIVNAKVGEIRRLRKSLGIRGFRGIKED